MWRFSHHWYTYCKCGDILITGLPAVDSVRHFKACVIGSRYIGFSSTETSISPTYHIPHDHCGIENFGWYTNWKTIHSSPSNFQADNMSMLKKKLDQTFLKNVFLTLWQNSFPVACTFRMLQTKRIEFSSKTIMQDLKVMFEGRKDVLQVRFNWIDLNSGHINCS